MKLFVGRLPYEVTEENLRELFEKFGSVSSAKVVMDRYTGRSRGFGFVEMSDESEAKEAMDKLDGSEVMGRTIVVKEANESEGGERREFRPRTGDRENRGGGGGGNREFRPPRNGGGGSRFPRG